MKDRSHLEKRTGGCITNKRMFVDKDDAKHNLKRMLLRGARGTLQVYRCKYCGMFHLGNKRAG